MPGRRCRVGWRHVERVSAGIVACALLRGVVCVLASFLGHPALNALAIASSAALWVGWVVFFAVTMIHNASIHRRVSLRRRGRVKAEEGLG